MTHPPINTAAPGATVVGTPDTALEQNDGSETVPARHWRAVVDDAGTLCTCVGAHVSSFAALHCPEEMLDDTGAVEVDATDSVVWFWHPVEGSTSRFDVEFLDGEIVDEAPWGLIVRSGSIRGRAKRHALYASRADAVEAFVRSVSA